MSASLSLEYTDNTGPIIEAMQRLIRAGQRPRPLLLQIGEYLVRSTQNRFDAQVSPDGQPWKPVTDARMLVKRIKKILTESSRLRDSVTYTASNSDLEWGTNVIYGGVHQWGKKTAPHDIRPKHGKALMFPGLVHPVKVVHHPGSDIPARQYLGISSSDASEILARINDYYQGALGK